MKLCDNIWYHAVSKLTITDERNDMNKLFHMKYAFRVAHVMSFTENHDEKRKLGKLFTFHVNQYLGKKNEFYT